MFVIDDVRKWRDDKIQIVVDDIRCCEKECYCVPHMLSRKITAVLIPCKEFYTIQTRVGHFDGMTSSNNIRNHGSAGHNLLSFTVLKFKKCYLFTRSEYELSYIDLREFYFLNEFPF